MSSNTPSLYFKSKKTSLILLAVTALVCSRMLFFFFDDPEGPNLLTVFVLALVIFLLSAVVYLSSFFEIYGLNRLLAVIGLQILAVVVLYFCMKYITYCCNQGLVFGF